MTLVPKSECGGNIRIYRGPKPKTLNRCRGIVGLYWDLSKMETTIKGLEFRVLSRGAVLLCLWGFIPQLSLEHRKDK